MNKISILVGFFTGFAGAVSLGRYMAAKKAARELHEYEEMDAGVYFDKCE